MVSCYHQITTDSLPAPTNISSDNENFFKVGDRQMPNSDTGPTRWLNGQQLNDEIKYFGTPIATDETLQQTTDELT